MRLKNNNKNIFLTTPNISNINNFTCLDATIKLNKNKTEYYKLSFWYEFYIRLPSRLKVKFCAVLHIAVHFPVINFTLTISLKAPRLSVTPSFPLIQICSLTSNSIFLSLRLIYLVTHLVAWGTFFWPETLEKSRNTHYNLVSLLQIT